MGQQGSKKKNKSGGESKGLFGDLAEAAEGATSALTKTIEDTSHQVTSKIDATTKSVTEAIDKTAKNVTGTVDGAVADANKKADEVGKNVDDAAANLRSQADAARKEAEEARKQVEGKAKGLKDAADSKARELEEAAKALEDAAEAKAKELEKAATDKKKELEEAAKGLQAAAEAKAKDAEAAAMAKKKEFENAALAKKKELEDAAAAKAKEAEDAAKRMKDAAEAKAKEAEAAAMAKKKEMETKAAELEKAAAARKKQLEEAATARIKEAELKAKEVQKSAEDAAEAKAKELEDAVAEASKQAEAKRAELETAASNKAKELQGQANAAGDSLRGKIAGAQSQAAGIRGQAEQTVADAKSQSQAAIDEAVNSAQKIQDDINRTIGDSKQALSDAQKQAQSAKAGLSDLAGNTAGLLKGTAETLTDTVKSTATAVVDQAVTMASETAKRSVQQVSGTLSKATEDVTKGVSGAVHNVSTSLTGAAGNMASGMLGKAGALTGALAQGASNISDMTKGFADDTTNRKADLDDIADSLIQDTTDKSKKAASNMDDIANNLLKDATDKSKKAASNMDDITNNLLKDASNASQKFKDEIKEVVAVFDPANATVVCKENELKDGEMKVFQVGEGSILLCREKGVYTAIGTKCSHYGAPLAKGVLSNGKVRCPWHGACFNTSTGDIEDSPGLDSVPCYSVKVEGGEVKVSAPADLLKRNIRTKDLAKRKSSDPRTFVIIGGGGAGEACAETLRQQGFSGRVVVLTKENDQPYDRPKLSKALSSTGKDIALRSPEYYSEGDIEIMLGHEVVAVNESGKTVQCKNGTKISYTALMIATGGSPVTLKVPGSDLENICYLRTPADANKIADIAKDKSAVIVGTSFIGMEVAAYLHGKAKSIDVIGRSSTPFANVFGPQVGERLTKLFTEKEVNFHFETEVEEFVGESGKLKAVKLKNGQTLNADVCVIGIGVRPATEFLKSSGILMNENGYIPVDETLKTSSDGIFAGGDIVEFPLSTYDDEFVTIGHWQIAQTHGRVAAKSMLGKGKPLHTVPFFWASMFGKSLRYAGCGLGVDDYIIDGDLDAMKFVCYACSGDKVVAVAAMGMDPVASQYASYISKGNVLKKSDIKSNPQGWLSEMC